MGECPLLKIWLRGCLSTVRKPGASAAALESLPGFKEYAKPKGYPVEVIDLLELLSGSGVAKVSLVCTRAGPKNTSRNTACGRKGGLGSRRVMLTACRKPFCCRKRNKDPG